MIYDELVDLLTTRRKLKESLIVVNEKIESILLAIKEVEKKDTIVPKGDKK